MADPPTPRAEILTHSTLTYRATRALTGIELACIHRARYIGTEHVAPEGGLMIVANHQSFLDIPLVANGAKRHVSFVARESLARSRFLAFIMRGCGAVLVRRGATERRSLTEMIDHLKAGDCVCVFPEGTRSRDGSLGSFLPGALFAAKRARVPIVPAGIRGALDALPRSSRWPFPRFKRISLEFGPPIDSREQSAVELARDSIASMIGDGRFGTMGDAVQRTEA